MNKVHSVPGRIDSISRPRLRPAVRGKAKAETESGAKPDISVSDGRARLEELNFTAYNDN